MTGRPGWLSLGLAVFFGALLLSACEPAAQPDELSDDLSRESLLQAVAESLNFLSQVPPDRVVGEWPRRLTAHDLRSVLLEFQSILTRSGPTPSTVPWLEDVAARFAFYPAPDSGAGAEPLFTGYYQPVLAASLIETPIYRYPLYGVPDEGARAGEGTEALVNLSRRDIDMEDALSGKGYEIAWLRDPVDRFFLHVQGSGLLELTDGSRVYVNFAASNERPYTSIGKVLIAAGKLAADALSMQSIRRYLEENPDEMEELFAANERYVFFAVEERGPVGSLGVPLTSGRSIATDAGIYPLGGLAFVETELPVLDAENRLVSWRRTRRFVLNQDTGAAIRGPRRVDLYFGSGPRAGARAGLMNKTGRLYFMLRKDSAGHSG